LEKFLSETKRYYRVSKIFLKNLFLKIYEDKVSILVILLVIAIFISAFKLEIHYQKANGFLDGDFWLESLLPNIIADMIGIIFTSFIIAGLFARQQKKSDEKKLYDILGHDYKILIDMLSRNILYLLKRDEEYLGFSVSDQTVKNDLKNLAFGEENFFDFDIFNSDFRVWDVNLGSSIVDSFVLSVRRIETHHEVLYSHYDDISQLYLKKRKLKFEINELDKDSIRYMLKFNEYLQVSDEARNTASVAMKLDEELLNIDMKDILEGCQKFFNNKTQEFCDKYTFILPIEIRLSLLELGKKIVKIKSDLYYYNDRSPSNNILSRYSSIDAFREEHKQQVFEAFSFISQDLINLSSYFKKHKYK